MQYIGYQFAKENDIVGQVIYAWMKTTPDLNIHIRGKVIKDWRNEELLLNIGEKLPNFFSKDTINQWTKEQANPKYHRKQYLRKYLERNLFKL